ncbi:MAG: signal peptide peptidase SppA [Actinomycetota bacterium]
MALGLAVLTAGAVALVVALGPAGTRTSAPATYDEEYVSGEGAAKIAVVPVEGTILSADDSVAGLQPTVTPEGLREALRQAAEDGSVEAVILAVNSPGGGVTASDEMHDAIMDFKRRTEKPVVVSMGDVAASGGYYVSTAADRIIANETTLTGSLGVFIPLLNFSEAADRYGVTQRYIKSGKFKAMGNPWHELTPEEREIFDSIVQDYYQKFVEVIVRGRDLPRERVLEIADGRVYSAEQARELGLVDSFGGLDEAAKTARDLAGISEARVVRYVQSPTLADALFARLEARPSEADRIFSESGLDLETKPYYLYLPGR